MVEKTLLVTAAREEGQAREGCCSEVGARHAEGGGGPRHRVAVEDVDGVGVACAKVSMACRPQPLARGKRIQRWNHPRDDKNSWR